MNSLGIYISVPFCRSKCTYCNFASGVYPTALHPRYVARLCAEIRGAAERTAACGAEIPRRVESVYLGGGTPTSLSPELWRELWLALRQEFDIAKTAEITIECAPGQLDDPMLDAVVQCGVNRLSFGVQSFIDREAAIIGRLHTREVALRDLERARCAGIERVSIDLIAGLPGQTKDSWRQSLEVLLGAGVGHASVYMLEVDEESRLGRELLAGGGRYHAAEVPNEELTIDLYETAIASLAGCGLGQYEISNFARPGQQSRHNLRYWKRQPYLGFGLDAHSLLRTPAGATLRFQNTAVLDEYVGAPAAPIVTRALSRSEGLEEAWFLGLRLREGVRWSVLQAEFQVRFDDEFDEFGRRPARPAGNDGLMAFHPIVEELCGLELLSNDGDAVRLTARGMLLSNEVFARFLDIHEAERMAPALFGGAIAV
jgi:oxygen-independent coproporphyrinogen-3 oxidase